MGTITVPVCRYVIHECEGGARQEPPPFEELVASHGCTSNEGTVPSFPHLQEIGERGDCPLISPAVNCPSGHMLNHTDDEHDGHCCQIK